ncbi:gluconate 2-dehydrogenase subunit 3 family protein [Runella salmonicolor]|uniref:Gluconate 2-dehydrogenase subunit 3 family protein n=1 Tax=Runella salmonicolor TaxID=2950278 RepID=A0ABT1FUW5_9BACT|nr:gluconate 2-dehydrogenase subunit 3 family protein [Runella salmonicolor]MCP1385551.1 gluconate 2-dehydrogenase subunit 3 family protein [Runella salmonicolor]
MNRREVLKNVALAAGGFVVLPTWAEAWSPSTIQRWALNLSPQQEALLVSVVDTIIPTTDTPGAKDLGVPDFIQKMLVDCYEKGVQENVKKGLEKTDAIAKDRYLRAFVDCNSLQRKDVLGKVAMSTDQMQKDYLTLVKSLTILGFTTSEYVQTKHLKYNQAPGHYYGCVPVQ